MDYEANEWNIFSELCHKSYLLGQYPEIFGLIKLYVMFSLFMFFYKCTMKGRGKGSLGSF